MSHVGMSQLHTEAATRVPVDGALGAVGEHAGASLVRGRGVVVHDHSAMSGARSSVGTVAFALLISGR